MDTEKLKPFNEFNSEKSAMVNEICYRLFNNPDSNPDSNFFKELKKIEIPRITGGNQIAMIIGGAEYENTGFIPILVSCNRSLAFGKYTDSSGTKLTIKNTTNAELSGGVIYLMVMEVM